jgi:hypothetical protein
MEIVNENALIRFEHYFHRRADVADQLTQLGGITDSLILATTALDALAKIWLHDFPETEKQLKLCYGGGIPESIRLSQLLKQFAPKDPDASKVAVVCFAEDWKLFRPEDSNLADQLLDKRLSNQPYPFLRSCDPPKSYLDVSLDDLEQECPRIAQNPKLRRITEEYEYGAILYNFYRCPLVHSSKSSDRTHGFTRGEEIMYYGSYVDPDRTTISFGPNLITRWLRIVVTNYVQHCREQNVIPADNLDAGLLPEDKLKQRWNKLKEKQKFPPICSDFVIELLSPSDSLKTTQEKMKEYIDNGVRLGILINRKSRQVEIYRSGKEVEVLDSPATVSGEDVLKGFVLNLGMIW